MLADRNPNLGASVGGYTLLHYVCSSGNYEIFDFILLKLVQAHGSLKKPLFDQDNPSKETCLHWAVLKNNYRISKRLIEEHRKLAELEGGDGAENSE